MLTQISYDYKSFTLATGQTDYDIKTNIAELFDNIKVARRVLIKSNVTISFKFNNANLPAIELVISGGINESNFEEYASCGVDTISIGRLTSGVNCADFSLEFME